MPIKRIREFFNKISREKEEDKVIFRYRKKKNMSLENVVFTIGNYTFLTLLCIIMLYPMVNTFAVAFNDPTDTTRGGIYLWPRVFSMRNFEVVFGMSTILGAFRMSVLKMLANVVTNLSVTTMLAYVLSRRDFVFNKPITLIFVLTMYFNAGLIPNFMLMRNLGLLNTFTVYWLPVMISAFNLIVLRTYIRSLPDSLMDSAKIDGASEFRIFLQIVVPLTIPAIATITLFVAVGSWNSWFETFLYNSSRQDLSTLQYELQKLLASAFRSGSSSSQSASAATTGQSQTVTPQSIRAAITIVTAVPILVVYPFLQRYFVTGLTLGGVKG
jgi:putative aldouronate transport system permease protein